MRLKTPLPSLEGITDWVQGEPNPEDNNQPLLVYFWAMSCHICHENMPKLQAWRDKYVPQGLKIVAIHCPRMKADTDIDKIKEKINEYGIVETCGIDNMHKAKKAFDNDLWPAYYLFDKEGKLVRRAAGKVGLSMLEPIIENLLA